MVRWRRVDNTCSRLEHWQQSINSQLFAQNQDFCLPHLHSIRGSPMEYYHAVWYGKTTMAWLPKVKILWRYVYSFLQNPRMWQTNTQDRQTPHDSINCIASCGKNYNHCTAFQQKDWFLFLFIKEILHPPVLNNNLTQTSCTHPFLRSSPVAFVIIFKYILEKAYMPR